MGLANRVFLLALAIAAGLGLAGCGKNCPTSSLGSSGGSSGSGGTVQSGGTICGPGSTPPGGGGSTSALLYYFVPDNAGAGTIEAAGLSNAGTLSLLSPYTAPALPTATDNMVVVNKRFLFVPMGNSTVQAFAINRASGALTPIAGSPFPAPGGADTAVSDPAGRFLFVGAEFLGEITVFQIDPTSGVLTTTGTFSSVNMVSADSLAVDGNGKFLYVGQGGASLPFRPIVAFSIDQNSGALAEIGAFDLGVATIHAEPSGKFLLGLAAVLDTGNPTNDAHISVFSIDATSGGLAAVAGSPFPTTSAPFEFVIHPSGKFVYTFGEGSTHAVTAVEGYQLNSTGTLTALPGSPFTSLPLVQDCQFDQSGGEAFCIDAIIGGTKFLVFNANPTTGMLTHTVQDLTVVNTFPFAVTN